jgi:hypothetical protein
MNLNSKNLKFNTLKIVNNKMRLLILNFVI